MKIDILTFDGFNEVDSFVAFNLINRVKQPHWKVNICCPTPQVTSMNGVVVQAQSLLADVGSADAVLVGSGLKTKEIIQDPVLMSQLQKLDPAKQLIGAQCSGALILAKLGLLQNIPACTDLISKPWVQEAQVEVLNQPFYAQNNMATAGGCLSAQYLAGWVIAKLLSLESAKSSLYYFAPVGEKEQYVERAIANIQPYL